MIHWFTYKKYPGFWNRYSTHFKNKKTEEIRTTRFVIFDTETTGLDIKSDRILSIGAISIINNEINVADNLELYIHQKKSVEKTVGIHGILQKGHIQKIEETEALVRFLEYIKDAILVAHHTAFDIAMINQGLSRLGLPRLKNKTLDTGILFKKTDFCNDKDKFYTLDELSEIYKIRKHDRHTASGDAYITGIIFLKIIASLQETKNSKLKDLFFNRNKRGLL